MSSPAPIAKGTLRTAPIPNLVVYALDHQLTGTLVLEEPDRQKHAIYFESGAPAKVRLAQPVARLGEVLVDLGYLTETEREETYIAAKATHRLHGEGLMAAGKLEERTLRDALREQSARKLLYLASLSPDTVFGYFDRVNYLETWGGPTSVRGKPLALVWRLVQATVDPARVSRVLEALGDAPLRLHLEAPIRRFHFGHVEQAIIDVLRAKPQPYSELAARDLAPPALLERLIYTLAITRQLDRNVPGAEPLGVDEAPSSTRIPIASSFTPPGGVYSPASRTSQTSIAPTSVSLPPSSMRSPVSSGVPPAAPVSVAPPVSERSDIRALKDELRARAERVDDTLYDVLGVPRDATVADIQAAYVALAKKWHPDRLGPEFQDVSDLATRVFARISEAHQVLTDSTKRREYNLKLRKAGAEANEQEHVQRVLRAATAFQKAEVLLKRNNLVEAEAQAKLALSEDPDQADHIALVAWIESQKPEADLRPLIRDLDRAISMQPNNLRAHWYRGQLYKRIGKVARAVQDFRFIVERDPRHVDASRELRLFQMRARNASSSGAFSSLPPTASTRPSPPPGSEKPSKGEGGGLISKLFKR